MVNRDCLKPLTTVNSTATYPCANDFMSCMSAVLWLGGSTLYHSATRSLFKTIHDRHHEASDNQGWTFSFQHFEPFLTIAGFYDHEALVL